MELILIKMERNMNWRKLSNILKETAKALAVIIPFIPRDKGKGK